MGAMQLHAVEARLDGAARGFTEIADHSQDFFRAQGPAGQLAVIERSLGRGQAARADQFTLRGQTGHGLVAGMEDLQHGGRSAAFCGLGQFAQTRARHQLSQTTVAAR